MQGPFFLAGGPPLAARHFCTYVGKIATSLLCSSERPPRAPLINKVIGGRASTLDVDARPPLRCSGLMGVDLASEEQRSAICFNWSSATYVLNPPLAAFSPYFRRSRATTRKPQAAKTRETMRSAPAPPAMVIMAPVCHKNTLPCRPPHIVGWPMSLAVWRCASSGRAMVRRALRGTLSNGR